MEKSVEQHISPTLFTLYTLHFNLYTFFKRRDAKTQSFFFVPLRLCVGFHPTVSRQGNDQASLSLLFWLNENVHLICLVMYNLL